LTFSVGASTISHVENLYQAFGDGVRRHRRLKQLSQEQLATKASMGRATVASIEAGRQVVALHQALAICAALEVDLGKLMAQTQELASKRHDLAGLLEPHDLEIVLEIQDGLAT